VRRKLGAVVIGTVAVALAAAGCQSNSGTPSSDASQGPVSGKLTYDDKAVGPAPVISGATKGGNITILSSADFDRFDPQADYRGDGIMVTNQLVARSLTGYYEDGNSVRLTGDLATTTGEQTNSCRNWKYTLRDNVKFEDGTAITSKDIAYGISRSFDSGESDGPTYLQRWLAGSDDYNSVYSGPFKNPGTIAPGIATPDSKTITFTFKDPHCDFPLAAALTTTVPVPAAKDKGPGNYETSVVASGPYKIKNYVRGDNLVLEKNPNWDPTSDPLRHQYADGFKFDFTAQDPDVVTERLVANGTADQAAIQWDNPSSAGLDKVTPDAQSRVLQGPTVFASYLYINTKRVADLDTRKALNYAYNKQAILQIIGGDKAGTIATTITAPVTPGYKKFDAFPAPATGDPAKAKDLLKGKDLTKPLTYCYRSGSDVRVKTAAATKEALEAVGFKINVKILDATNYYPTVGIQNTDCDLIPGAWGQDFPDGNTVLGVIMNGSEATRPTGNSNLSYLNNDGVNSELKRLAELPDRTTAGVGYGNLDQKIMTEQAPVVPIYYRNFYGLYGSKIGGTYLSGLWGYPSLQNVYVKQ
jgi:peptide/nickel transport system substrate-binding protein